MGSLDPPPPPRFSFRGPKSSQLRPPSGMSRERPPWSTALRSWPAEGLDGPTAQGGGRRGQRPPPRPPFPQGLWSPNVCAPACGVSEILPGEPLVFGRLQK